MLFRSYCSLTSVRSTVCYFVPISTSVNPPCFNAGAKTGKLHQMLDRLVIRLDGYSGTLLRNLRQFPEVGDRRGAEVIRHSCVTCVVHLAMLCNLTSGLESNSKPQIDAVCDSSSERLGHLTQRHENRCICVPRCTPWASLFVTCSGARNSRRCLP